MCCRGAHASAHASSPRTVSFFAHTPLGFLIGLYGKGVSDPYVSTDGWVKGWGDVATDGVDACDQCLG